MKLMMREKPTMMRELWRLYVTQCLFYQWNALRIKYSVDENTNRNDEDAHSTKECSLLRGCYHREIISIYMFSSQWS